MSTTNPAFKTIEDMRAHAETPIAIELTRKQWRKIIDELRIHSENMRAQHLETFAALRELKYSDSDPALVADLEERCKRLSSKAMAIDDVIMTINDIIA